MCKAPKHKNRFIIFMTFYATFNVLNNISNIKISPIQTQMLSTM